MADHPNLAETLLPFIEDMEASDKRADMEDAIDFVRDVDVRVVAAEYANKGVSRIRKATREGLLHVIADRGHIRSLKEAEVVMTADQLLGLLGRAYEGGERHGATRRPADAVLGQLEPTDPGLASLRISRRAADESQGGRRGLR